LLEILVVIALLGLMSMVLIGGTGRLLESKRDNPEDMALGAIVQARQGAVSTGRIVDLRAEEIGGASKDADKTAAIERAVRFLPLAMEAASLVGGQLHEEALPSVRFYADGTCDPFRVELTGGGSRRILTIDPWTCTVITPAMPASP